MADDTLHFIRGASAQNNSQRAGELKSNVNVRVEEDVLHVEGRLDLTKYQGLHPLYASE